MDPPLRAAGLSLYPIIVCFVTITYPHCAYFVSNVRSNVEKTWFPSNPTLFNSLRGKFSVRPAKAFFG